MRIATISVVVAASAVTLVATLSTTQQSGLPQPADPLSVARPPVVKSLQAALRPPVQTPDRGVYGEVHVYPSERLLRINWGFDDQAGSRRVFRPQSYDLNYWPTAAVVVDDDLIVAGLRGSDGHTVIERWKLDYPPAPQNLKYAVSVIPPVEILYDDRLAGKDTVRFMEPAYRAGGPPDHVLVHFQDSNDLYSFDLSSRTFSVVFTSQEVPALADDVWAYIWAGEHAEQGYVYVYYFLLGGDVPDVLVLLDGDRDGSIDNWVLLDEAGWDTLLQSPTTWVEVFE